MIKIVRLNLNVNIVQDESVDIWSDNSFVKALEQSAASCVDAQQELNTALDEGFIIIDSGDYKNLHGKGRFESHIAYLVLWKPESEGSVSIFTNRFDTWNAIQADLDALREDE